ncbi:MAG TPA: hypothetical protein VKB34_08700 [Povalibacter sp.]|nr:hypothetical protein [Povalibacter sp.]
MNAPDDKAFEEYLGRTSQVSQRYRELQANEVPAALDEKILAQARTALTQPTAVPHELESVRGKRRRLMQWGVPTALAASALLVVSIVVRSGMQRDSAPFPQTPAAPQPAAKAEESAATPEQNGVVIIAPPRDAVTEFSSLAPSEQEREAAIARQQRADAERVQAESTRAQGYRANAESAMLSRRSVAAPAVAAPEAAAPPSPAPAAEASQSVEIAGQAAAAAPAPAVRDAANPFEVAPQSPTQQAEAKQVAGQQLDELVMRPAHPAGPHNTVTGNSSSGTTDAELESLHSDPPAWLEHIRQLRRDGRPTAANREWQEFRKRYPDYAVAETDLARGRN